MDLSLKWNYLEKSKLSYKKTAQSYIYEIKKDKKKQIYEIYISLFI